MPPNTVYVGRPTKWGNPFKLSEFNDVRTCLEKYEAWLNAMLCADSHFLDPLRGKDLACWCRLDQPCHSDILLRNLVDVHDVEKWPWIECPRCRFGQRADPELLKKGKFTCPDCKIEMKVMPEPTD